MIFQEQVLVSSALNRIVIRAGDSADLLDHVLFQLGDQPQAGALPSLGVAPR